MGFCTVADLAAFLQIAIDPGNAAALAAIDEATEAIRNYCHQTISLVEDDKVTLDVAGRATKLFLPELPVVAVDVVEEEDANGVLQELTVTDDFKLGPHGILHRVSDYWAYGIQMVAVTYTHGYEVIPEDVEGVCTRAAARRFQAGLRAAAEEGISGVQAMSLGDYSVTYGSEQGGGVGGGGMLGASAASILLPSEKAILNRYRYIAQ